MKSTFSFETLVDFQQTTWLYASVDRTLHNHLIMKTISSQKQKQWITFKINIIELFLQSVQYHQV
jgi:hypothetical protein